MEVLEKYRMHDILVSNLGGSEAHGGGFAVLADQDWETSIQTNLLAPLRQDRGFLPEKVGSSFILLPFNQD